MDDKKLMNLIEQTSKKYEQTLQRLGNGEPEEMRLVKFRVIDYNLPSVVSGDISYFAEDVDSIKKLQKQNPEVEPIEIEIIRRKEYDIPLLQRTAANGFSWTTDFTLENIHAEFLWVRCGKQYHRAYKLQAKVIDEERAIKSIYGNGSIEEADGVLRSICYHICAECNEGEESRTSGVLIDLKGKDECLRDIDTFDAAEYHYKEFLEDILGDAG